MLTGVVPWNQIRDKSQRPGQTLPTLPSTRPGVFSLQAIPSDTCTSPNQPGNSAEAHSGPAWSRCEMNVSAAILVTGTSSGVHHDHYNSFGLLQLPSDTCFRLRAIFLATRFLKSFSLCCFCTEVIHFSHHNF